MYTNLTRAYYAGAGYIRPPHDGLIPRAQHQNLVEGHHVIDVHVSAFVSVEHVTGGELDLFARLLKNGENLFKRVFIGAL